jgi:hypothetical protein
MTVRLWYRTYIEHSHISEMFDIRYVLGGGFALISRFFTVFVLIAFFKEQRLVLFRYRFFVWQFVLGPDHLPLILKI